MFRCSTRDATQPVAPVGTIRSREPPLLAPVQQVSLELARAQWRTVIGDLSQGGESLRCKPLNCDEVPPLGGLVRSRRHKFSADTEGPIRMAARWHFAAS